MSEYVWPTTLRPLTSKNYSYGRGGNVLATPVAGGVPRNALDRTLDTPTFKLNFTMSDFQYQMALMFYEQRINHGADSFGMNLNSGNGIEQHQVSIVPGTWKAVRPSDGTWYIAFDVIAESTSSQEDTCAAILDLYECNGDQLPCILKGLETWVEAFPNG